MFTSNSSSNSSASTGSPSSTLLGVKLNLIRRLRDFASQRPAPFEKLEDGTWSDAKGWTVAAAIAGLIGSQELVGSDRRWASTKDGQMIDASTTLTGRSRLSLVDLLKSESFEGDTNMHRDLGVTFKEICREGKADLFISFANIGGLSNCVDAIENYLCESGLDEESTYLYFAPVLCNHWDSSAVKDPLVVKRTISEIGHTAVVMTPWEDPLFLTQSWCLWEVYCSQTDGAPDTSSSSSLAGREAKFGVAMGRLEMQSYVEGVIKDLDAAVRPYEMISSRKWEQGLANLRLAIDASPGGLYGLNKRIFEGITRWMLATMDRELSRRRLRAQSGEESCDNASFCSLLGVVSRLARTQGENEIERIESLGKECFEKRKQVLGVDHPDTLKSMSYLASYYASSRDFDKSVTLEEDSYRRRKRILGDDHPETLTSMSSLARYLEGSDLEKAFLMGKKCFEIRKKTLGDLHRDTLISMKNLTSFYFSKGMLSEAISLAEECTEKHKLVFGVENMATLDCMSKLAIYCDVIGDLDKSILIEQEIFKIRKQFLGVAHPETILSMCSLSKYYVTKGDYKTGTSIGEESFEVQRSALGDCHRETLNLQISIASMYNSIGNCNRAIALIDDCLEKCRRTLGDSNELTLTSMSDLADYCKSRGEKGDLKRAILLGEECLDKRKRALGENHPHTLSSMNSLVFFYNEINLSKAMEIGDDCLRRRKRVLGEFHSDTLSSMSNLGFIYHSKGDMYRAITLEEECLQKRRSMLGSDHTSTLKSLSNLSQYYTLKQDFNRAIPLEQELYEKRKKQLGENHPVVEKLMKSIVSLKLAKEREREMTDGGTSAVKDRLRKKLEGKKTKEGEALTALGTTQSTDVPLLPYGAYVNNSPIVLPALLRSLPLVGGGGVGGDVGQSAPSLITNPPTSPPPASVPVVALSEDDLIELFSNDHKKQSKKKGKK